MRRRVSWRSERPHRWLATASLALLMLLLQACGGDNGFNTKQTKGGSQGVGVSNNTFAGRLMFVKAGNILILNGNDDSLTQVTSDGDSFQPSLSRDGKTIAFELRKPGLDYSDLATMPLSGGTPTVLTDDSQHMPSPGTSTDSHNHYQFWATNPIWTADGQNIIYLSDFFKGGAYTPYANQTCLGQSDGPNATWIVDMGIVELPASTRPVPGGQVKDPPKLLAWPYCFAGGDQSLSLRPGVMDTEVLFTSFKYVPPQDADFTAQLSLLTVSPKGQNQIIQLSPEDANNVILDPSWSPDGRYITYIKRENGQDNLYIMPVDATITGTPNDESYLLEDGTNSVYYTNTDYYMKAQLLASGIIGQPVWGNNNTLFFIMFANGEYNLYMAKVKFTNPTPTPAPKATPSATPGTTPTASGPAVPVITLDGSPMQLTQGGVDADSRPVWFSS